MTATPMPSHICYERLGAEIEAGFSVQCNLDVSLTTLAFIVMACQHALKCPNLAPSAETILKDFAVDAEAKANFPPELTKLIESRWS